MSKKRIKILIVEDELSYRELYEEILAIYDLQFAINLQEAKLKLNKFKPDIAIIDIRLQNIPGNTDGLDLADYINLTQKNIVKILNSGFPVQSQEIQERINRIGIFAVLDKSSNEQAAKILETVATAINIKRPKINLLR